jgi:hypothetical protein
MGTWGEHQQSQSHFSHVFPLSEDHSPYNPDLWFAHAWACHGFGKLPLSPESTKVGPISEGLLRDKTRPPGRKPVPTATVAKVLALTQGEPFGDKDRADIGSSTRIAARSASALSAHAPDRLRHMLML